MNINKRMLNALKEVKACCDACEKCEDCIIYGENMCDDVMPIEWNLDELEERNQHMISSEPEQPKIKYLEEEKR